MIEFFRHFAFATTEWLASQPLVMLLIVLIAQISLVAILASTISRRFARHQPRLAYNIYLASIVCVLALLPIHLTLRGWTIRTPLVPVIDNVSMARVGDSRDDVPPVGDLNAKTVIDGIASAGTIGTIIDEDSVTSDPRVDGTLTSLVNTNDASIQTPAQRISLWRFVPIGLAWMYVFGCLIATVRFLVGAIQFANATRRGVELSGEYQQEFLSATNDAGLQHTARVRVSDVAMPMAFGLLRPVVLLPHDYRNWSADERRATLLHELSHIRRGDMIGQYLSVLMRVLYWFHPACRYLDRRLQETREWATDAEVVQCGMYAESYAECLLNIVARVQQSPAQRRLSVAAIAMSAGAGLERRMRRILQGEPRTSLSMRVAVPCWIATLLLVTAVTTVRLEIASAQNPQNVDSIATPQPSGTSVRADSIDESDLISRISDCEVLNVTGDEFSAIFTVTGQVVSPAGEPVAGAIVLLRESSNRRVSGEPGNYSSATDRHLLRVQDVFARTVSDAEGKFNFQDVRAPALLKRNVSVQRDVVAAHPMFGIAYTALPPTKEIHRRHQALSLTLQPTMTIHGQFVSPEGKPVADAIVNLTTQGNLVSGRGMEESKFDLTFSQLSPRTRTDSRGHFVISNVMRGTVGSLWLNHPDFADTYTYVAIGDEVPLGKQQMHESEVDVQSLPASIVADPGFIVHGRVLDSNGRPVSEVRVSFATTVMHTQSGEDGSFQLRISKSNISFYRERQLASVTVYAGSKPASGVLSNSIDISLEDIEAAKPITFQLNYGTLVKGKVITEAGEPVADALVQSLETKVLAPTAADGSFEMVLAKKPHTLVVGTDEGGFSLPTRLDLYRVKPDQDVSDLTHKKVDLSSGDVRELSPLVALKTKPVQVIVSLPDGRPAIGATAQIKEEETSNMPNAANLPPMARMKEKSDAAITNQLGRADLLPQGTLSDKAFVEVKLASETEAYDVSAPLSQAVDGVVTVVLQSAWIIEGRVLVDGEPIAGAVVSIGQSTPFKRTVNGMTAMFSTVSNHVTATTGEDGWYRAAVPRGKTYSVSVQRLPSDPDASPGIGYGATENENGRMRVRDFAFITGDQEIAGRVVDPQGQPVAEANVQIMRSRDGVEPGFWIGHRKESQHQTDASGRFHLKKMPKGSYSLNVSGPRVANQRGASTMATADTGMMNVEILLATQTVPSEPPRLQPRRIEPVKPASPQ